jgi:organic hydroperoxide reductase OsmC/OhrA
MVARGMPHFADAMTERVRSQTRVIVRHEEGFQFLVRFDVGRAHDLLTDEPPPLGSGDAPNPTALLAASIGNCLASSLLFCMQKSRLEMRDLEAEVVLSTGRNSEGRLRIELIEARLSPVVTAETRDQMERCTELFQSFCTVTESVRGGIPVEVRLQPRVVDPDETSTPPAGLKTPD